MDRYSSISGLCAPGLKNVRHEQGTDHYVRLVCAITSYYYLIIIYLFLVLKITQNAEFSWAHIWLYLHQRHLCPNQKEPWFDHSILYNNATGRSCKALIARKLFSLELLKKNLLTRLQLFVQSCAYQYKQDTYRNQSYNCNRFWFVFCSPLSCKCAAGICL